MPLRICGYTGSRQTYNRLIQPQLHWRGERVLFLKGSPGAISKCAVNGEIMNDGPLLPRTGSLKLKLTSTLKKRRPRTRHVNDSSYWDRGRLARTDWEA